MRPPRRQASPGAATGLTSSKSRAAAGRQPALGLDAQRDSHPHAPAYSPRSPAGTYGDAGRERPAGSRGELVEERRRQGVVVLSEHEGSSVGSIAVRTSSGWGWLSIEDVRTADPTKTHQGGPALMRPQRRPPRQRPPRPPGPATSNCSPRASSSPRDRSSWATARSSSSRTSRYRADLHPSPPAPYLEAHILREQAGAAPTARRSAPGGWIYLLRAERPCARRLAG